MSSTNHQTHNNDSATKLFHDLNELLDNSPQFQEAMLAPINKDFDEQKTALLKNYLILLSLLNISPSKDSKALTGLLRKRLKQENINTFSHYIGIVETLLSTLKPGRKDRLAHHRLGYNSVKDVPTALRFIYTYMPRHLHELSSVCTLLKKGLDQNLSKYDSRVKLMQKLAVLTLSIIVLSIAVCFTLAALSVFTFTLALAITALLVNTVSRALVPLTLELYYDQKWKANRCNTMKAMLIAPEDKLVDEASQTNNESSHVTAPRPKPTDLADNLIRYSGRYLKYNPASDRLVEKTNHATVEDERESIEEERSSSLEFESADIEMNSI